MSMRIIGAAIGHGAQDPDSENAPDFLRINGLAKTIEAAADASGCERFREVSWDTTLYPHYTKGFKKDLPIVGEFSERLRKVVNRVHSDGDFPLVIGGDHSCAIGTWSGVATAIREEGREAPGLIWIDAHLDSHTFETSPSWAIHGMPLACLLGKGQKSLAQCGGFSPKINASASTVIGARSWEEGEAELLEHLGVKVVTAMEILEKGWQSILEEASQRAREAGSWGVTIDLDAFDPGDAPGVCSPEVKGPSGNDFATVLANLKWGRETGFRAAEIVEFAPKYDTDGKTLQLVKNIVSALAG